MIVHLYHGIGQRHTAEFDGTEAARLLAKNGRDAITALLEKLGPSNGLAAAVQETLADSAALIEVRDGKSSVRVLRPQDPLGIKTPPSELEIGLARPARGG